MMHKGAKVADEFIIFLLDHGADALRPTLDGNPILHWAVKEKRVDLVTRLLKLGINPLKLNRRAQTLFCVAVDVGNYQLANILPSNFDMDHKREVHLLTLSASRGSVEIVRLLLSRGAELNPEPRLVCEDLKLCPIAAAFRHENVMEILLEAGANPNTMSSTNGGNDEMYKI
jgi:ankyrin repeat protein